MKAIHFEQPGPPSVLSLRECSQPEAGPGEVLIQVRAAGVNRPDVLQRKGLYPPPPGASPILGLEVSGVIAEVGPGTQGRWRVGDAVCALLAGGGYAELAVAPEGQCLPLPRGWDWIQGAALPETLFTVWKNVFELGRLAPGESLLIHGGSSGIGTLGIQLARAWGSRVFVTAGSPEKCQACRDLGAEQAVTYREQDFTQVLTEMDVI
jgi:NADPH2:quinone reductase